MIFASSLLPQKEEENDRNSQSADSHDHLQPPVSAAETAEAHMSV